MTTVFDSMADQLAEQSYAVADHFLSEAEVDAIIAPEIFEHPASAFRKAGVGARQDRQVNEGIRGDYIQWLDENTAPRPLALYLARIRELVDYLNQTLFLSLKDIEIHKTIYPPGSFYKRHLDQFRTDDHRRLSLICYLNRDWKEEHGGQLRIYQQEAVVDILPCAGRLVCFRSDRLEHEVLPATRPRLSLTGWLLDQYSDLRHL
jgi:SM-20-related protein